ncbi:hypothetical protein B0H14DRAFT_3490134 [Mycena olivaceomarginata]|nr:hypothetical protein B0H14DRAFT_3490134 [Mycena olivaceomarginata]
MAFAKHTTKIELCLQYWAQNPYVNEGLRYLYVVGALEMEVAEAYNAGNLGVAELWKCLDLKLGHSKDIERWQGEYTRCEMDGKVHIWVCKYHVPGRYLCECLIHLGVFRDGAEQASGKCVCGVKHRKFFTFKSLSGWKPLDTIICSILFSQNEQYKISPPDPPTSAPLEQIFNLIRNS